MSKLLKSLLASSTAMVMGLNSVALAQTQKKLERPPQFVMLAFDGSFNNDFWKESRAFAQTARAANKPLSFTYFISGVYWIHEGNYALYVPPHKEAAYPSRQAMEDDVEQRLAFASNLKNPKEKRIAARRGWSDSGFGNEAADVALRTEQVSLAFNEGHEIASHANGHFAAGTSTSDSRKWTVDQWNSEHKQFFNLIFNVYENNNIPNRTKYATGYSFTKQDIVGFRAPTLDMSPAGFTALHESGFTYDTSGLHSSAEDPLRWPKKDSLGTWVLPLGDIQLAGTTKHTASMDYNFYVSQSRGVDDLANKDKYSQQMYDSYMKYFNDNYYGNRAPVHIGHHFSKWNGGAYWAAMQKFALQVCGKPEVRCVTYQQYVAWLNDEMKDPQTKSLQAYAKKEFEPMARPAGLKALAVVGETKPVLSLENGSLKASAEMDRLSKVLSYKLALKVDNKLQKGKEVSLADLRKSSEAGSKVHVSAVVLNAQGDEVNSFTVKIDGIGTAAEAIDMNALENRALMGDLPEAHEHE